ncbi:MAG: aldo/keto reductase, partial [Gemmatimonadetes bacterium]|nr:aldo/keto reductase [Gemmatimonadota bacterium]
MLYRAFGRTGWQVSAIGLGTWNIGNQWGPIDEATAWDTVRTAFDCGVNLFDAAESYGTPNGLSEERLGSALAGIRHQVFVVSKIGNWGARTGQGVPKTTVDMIRLCAHASLHRLR